MNDTAPITPKQQIEAFAASALLWLAWLAAVIASLGAPRRSRLLKRWVTRLECDAERIVFLQAADRLRPPSHRRVHPGVAGPGFRCTRSRLRLFMKSARIRARGASLSKRVRRIIAALEAPDRFITRFVKRLRRGLCPFHYTAVAPPAVVCASVACGVVSAIDDS